MRVFRMFVVGMLIAGGMVMVAEAPGGSVPAASKSCKSLQALDKQLSVVRSNNYKSSTISSMAKSFRDAGKSAPKSIKSAMNTIATVASDAAAAGSVSGAAAALRKDGTKLATAVAKWGTYLSTNC